MLLDVFSVIPPQLHFGSKDQALVLRSMILGCGHGVIKTDYLHLFLDFYFHSFH